MSFVDDKLIKKSKRAAPIRDYVSRGGGLVGVCAGAIVAALLLRRYLRLRFTVLPGQGAASVRWQRPTSAAEELAGRPPATAPSELARMASRRMWARRGHAYSTRVESEPAAAGLLVHGTTSHWFYGKLDNAIPGKGGAAVASKVFIDQVLEEFNTKNADKVTLSSLGEAITKSVTIAEIVKHRVAGLHQVNEISTIVIDDEYEPLEEGLEKMPVSRKLTCLQPVYGTKHKVYNTKCKV